MNRILNLFDDLDIGGEPFAADAAQGYQLPGLREDIGLALFSPLHYEPNYAYPLIVWLHGPGADERQLRKIMPSISMRNYVGAAVRGTLALGSREAGFAWSQSAGHIRRAEERTLAAVAAAQRRFNISSSRIFLAGFDCGGTMALRIACQYPDRFAGVLSMGGEFPLGNAPLSRLAEVRRLAVLLATGRDSDRYPPERVCENLRLFYAAGMSIHLRQYPVAQDLTTQMLSDMDRWIMEQITSPSGAPGDCLDGAKRDS
jgi:phospholipase/carboxylesterase